MSAFTITETKSSMKFIVKRNTDRGGMIIKPSRDLLAKPSTDAFHAAIRDLDSMLSKELLDDHELWKDVEVNFAKCVLERAELTPLLEVLAKHRIMVKVLKLYQSGINDSCMEALASFVNVAPLQEIHLSHNKITVDGALTLLRGFRQRDPGDFPPARPVRPEEEHRGRAGEDLRFDARDAPAPAQHAGLEQHDRGVVRLHVALPPEQRPAQDELPRGGAPRRFMWGMDSLTGRGRDEREKGGGRDKSSFR